MGYRSILVQLDESRRCATRVDVAAALAASHGSRLVGVAPTGLFELAVGVAPAPFGAADFLAKARAGLHEHAAAVVNAFLHQVEARGLADVQGLVDEDDAIASLIRQGRCADLIVVGQFDADAVTLNVPSDLPQRVVLQAGRPVLVVPFAGEFAAVGRHVVVAWKDSRETARAMGDALPLLQQAETVSLLAFADPTADDAQTLKQMNAHCEWLSRHGVKAQARLDHSEADTGNALLSRAFDLGADLIVMGGYGHSRAHEFVLGGVTRTLLKHMTVPVLMGH